MTGRGPPAYRPAERAAGGLLVADRPDPLNEAELARIWASQSFPPEALSLVDGRRLRVIQPGRTGGGSGPDFRDALIAIEGEERRGHVELHVRASSFREHGHHRDPAYRGLALHVVYRADEGAETRLDDDSTVPVAAFEPWLARRESELQGWLAAPPLWREPCADARERLGGEGVAEALRRAGRERLATRIARLREAVDALGPEEAFWRALLDSLGSGGDRAAWRRLALALPPDALRAGEAAGLAAADLLLGVAGLAPLPEPADLALQPILPAMSGGSRPLNRPQRRLQALAVLWRRAEARPAAYALSSVAAAADVRQLTRAWLAADPLGGPALLGPERARELLLNAVLPFAACRPELATQAQRLLEGLPAAGVYGKTAFLEQNLRGESGRRPLRTALEQQGLLALHAAWCTQGGCGRCPLS